MKKSIIITIIVGLLIVSCSSSPNIIGSWTDSIGTIYTFNRDGTMTIADGFGLSTTTGTYEFVDKDTIEIKIDGMLGLAGPNLVGVDISGDQLSLDVNGVVIATLNKN